jgi:hypothetical protein
MARLITRLALTTTIPRRRPARVLALVAIVAMLVGSLAPAWALGAEAESEGEGQGTAPPRLGNPEFEPGGAETVLEGFGGPTGGEEVEEDEVVPPVEAEPPQEVEVPEATPEVEEAPLEAPPVEQESEAPEASPPPAAAAAPTSPEYAPSPTPPTYETSPPASSQPVQNEAIVAPKATEGSPPGRATPKQPVQTSPPETQSEEPAAPAPSTPASTLPAVPAADAGRQGPGRITAGRSAYTVHPGDCLWSIAEALLPPGSDNTRIAAEVSRLWQLNAERIGTGDPNLILAGTVLRLG